MRFLLQHWRPIFFSHFSIQLIWDKNLTISRHIQRIDKNDIKIKNNNKCKLQILLIYSNRIFMGYDSINYITNANYFGGVKY